MITNTASGTSIEEIADGLHRINTPIQTEFGGFSFNQYLLVDEAPLLFHTGPRRLFPLVREAVGRVTDAAGLRYIAFSHYEADECGSLNDWLALAPQAVALCGRIAAMTSVGDVADRPPQALADGEALSTGRRRFVWFDTPHLPHAWECGYLMEETSGTLLCGDLFTQAGSKSPAVTEADILEPSERMRKGMEYYSHTPNTRAMLERLAACNPKLLACMHGSAWRGDGAALLRALADRLTGPVGTT